MAVILLMTGAGNFVALLICLIGAYRGRVIAAAAYDAKERVLVAVTPKPRGRHTADWAALGETQSFPAVSAR